MTAAQIQSLKRAYRLLYREGLKLEDALARIESEIPTTETGQLTAFIRATQRGIARGATPRLRY